MGYLKQLDQIELSDVPDSQKITVTFTKNELDCLMDLVDMYKTLEPQSFIDKERLKKKPNELLIKDMQAQIYSINVLKKRMFDAWPETSMTKASY